jgi:predicted glycosyltransferase
MGDQWRYHAGRSGEANTISSVNIKDRLLNAAEARKWQAAVRPVAFAHDAPPRVMLYCASNVGLGHLHRLKRLAVALRKEIEAVDLLLVTDTQSLSAAEIDPDVGLVRLPGSQFQQGSFEGRAAGLSLDKNQLRDLRANLILAAGISFRPDALVMDTNPHGKRNELEPLLKHLARMDVPPYRVLEVRDIPFPPDEQSRLNADPKRVAADFALYDAVYVAGAPEFFDLAAEYKWPRSLAERLNYLGFVLPEMATHPPKHDPRVRRITAALGGGWEVETFGRPLIEAALKLRDSSSFSIAFTLVTGPAVDESARDELAALAKGAPEITLERYTSEFHGQLRSSDLAVLQAGSTPFQILDTDIQMLIYSRDYATREQEVRAERLARYPGVGRLLPDDLEPDSLARRMREALDSPRVARKTGLGFNGAQQAAKLLAAELSKRGAKTR